MLQNKKKWALLQVALLCVMLLVIIGLPASSISAETVSSRDRLGNSITFCEKLDSTKYTPDSWKAFQMELKEAKAVYAKSNKSDDTYTVARFELQTVKASLMFVMSNDKGNPLPFRVLTGAQISAEMGTGWNLGNTMDGNNNQTPGETTWQPYVTTKALIKSVHDMGFNTIRIPVTWGTMIDDKNGYTINEAWISRVQDIVDYAISMDMYVVINIHHDGAGWFNLDKADIDYDFVYTKFEHTWRNIAERFKDYNDHLIFEALNELSPPGLTIDGNKLIMNFDQIFVNVVRSTGSNNAKRWLSVPPRYANIDAAAKESNGFKLPVDTVKNRLFVSVHDYELNFGLVPDMKVTKYISVNVKQRDKIFKQLYDQFIKKGIPVMLGEYGAVNKNNTPERAYYYEAMTRICQRYGIVACAWDIGWYSETKTKSPDYSFTLVERSTNKQLYPEIISAIMRGTFLKTKVEDYSDIIKNPKITKISSITLSKSSLTMTIGDAQKIITTVKPSNTNEVVIWKSANESIASVSGGHVRARGIGTTTLTAFSQSGSVKKTVKVTVKAKNLSKPCTSISIDSDAYNLVKDKYIYLKVSLAPANTDDYVTYTSSNESVATVSIIGKIVALKEGTATITITASNGLAKTVDVKVTKN